MRAFAGGYYNNLKALYDHLGVAYKPQTFLFSFSNLDSHEEEPYFIHSSNNHRIPPLKPAGRSWLSYTLEVIYLWIWYTYFTFCCTLIRPHPSETHKKPCESLEAYLNRIHLPRYFTTHYILPLMSSVTTCPHADLLRFPAVDVVEYKKRTHGAQHYTVTNGVGDAQSRLAHGIDTRFSTHVTSVIPSQSNGGRVVLEWRQTEDTHGLTSSTKEEFDTVILSVSPDLVSKIFKPLQRAMASIPTIRVESTVHTDDEYIGSPSLLHLENGSNAQSIHLRTSMSEERTESVHVQPSGVLVTTCPISPIKKDSIIQPSTFTRVLRTPQSRDIINGIINEDVPGGHYLEEKRESAWKNGDGGVWLVGGWCWDGMVLLEGCVVSALRVAGAFGVRPPWETEHS